VVKALEEPNFFIYNIPTDVGRERADNVQMYIGPEIRANGPAIC